MVALLLLLPQRRLMPLLPPELGDYLLNAQRGFEATADVAVVGPALRVLDADLAFEVRELLCLLCTLCMLCMCTASM